VSHLERQRRPLRHRHALEHQLVVLDGKPRLVVPPQAAHFGAPYVVGDEADDDDGRLVRFDEALGPQHDLVEAVTGHAAVQYTAARQLLQLRRPGVGVADILAVGKGIAHGEDRALGRSEVLATEPQAVGADRDGSSARNGGGRPGARHMPQQAIVNVEDLVGHGPAAEPTRPTLRSPRGVATGRSGRRPAVLC
jgi:hypothetical protein